MQHPATRDLRQRLLEESQEIGREFQGRASPETVARCMTEARSRLAGARVTDYVPIFFGRRARRLLREATGAAPGRAHTA